MNCSSLQGLADKHNARRNMRLKVVVGKLYELRNRQVCYASQASIRFNTQTTCEKFAQVFQYLTANIYLTTIGFWKDCQKEWEATNYLPKISITCSRLQPGFLSPCQFGVSQHENGRRYQHLWFFSWTEWIYIYRNADSRFSHAVPRHRDVWMGLGAQVAVASNVPGAGLASRKEEYHCINYSQVIKKRRRFHSTEEGNGWLRRALHLRPGEGGVAPWNYRNVENIPSSFSCQKPRSPNSISAPEIYRNSWTVKRTPFLTAQVIAYPFKIMLPNFATQSVIP